LQIHSGICAPKIIKTERDLTKVIEKIKRVQFLPHSVVLMYQHIIFEMTYITSVLLSKQTLFLITKL